MVQTLQLRVLPANSSPTTRCFSLRNPSALEKGNSPPRLAQYHSYKTDVNTVTRQTAMCTFTLQRVPTPTSFCLPERLHLIWDCVVRGSTSAAGTMVPRSGAATSRIVNQTCCCLKKMPKMSTLGGTHGCHQWSGIPVCNCTLW